MRKKLREESWSLVGSAHCPWRFVDRWSIVLPHVTSQPNKMMRYPAAFGALVLSADVHPVAVRLRPIITSTTISSPLYYVIFQRCVFLDGFKSVLKRRTLAPTEDRKALGESTILFISLQKSPFWCSKLCRFGPCKIARGLSIMLC